MCGDTLASRHSKFLRLGASGLVLGAALFVGGCSSNVSRFDYPAFAHNSGSEMTTGSVNPVPSASIYPNGSPSNTTAVMRQDLPPPQTQPYGSPQAYASTQTAPPPAPPQTYATPPAYTPPVPRPAPVARAPLPPKPSYKTITVSRGDTLSKYSREYGVSVDDIKAANDMSNTRLSLGQTIKIPVSGAVKTASASGTADYVVRSGDSVSKIARAKGISQDDLIKANDLKKPYRLSLGQKLKIPGQTVTAAASPAPVRVASRGPNIPLPAAKPKPVAPVATAPATRTAARTTNLPKPEPMAGNQFRWPVKGRIISGYGQKPNGKHNDGVNIAVPKGTSIKAAENGVVAYAGSELQPYGNLVLIRHANNWVTAYAHNEELLVKRGDTVRRGQIISKAGQSGNVSQPQLHFELRRGSKPVNPLSYMASGA